MQPLLPLEEDPQLGPWPPLQQGTPIPPLGALQQNTCSLGPTGVLPEEVLCINLIRVALQRGLPLCQNERGCDFAYSPPPGQQTFPPMFPAARMAANLQCTDIHLQGLRVCVCVCKQGGGITSEPASIPHTYSRDVTL